MKFTLKIASFIILIGFFSSLGNAKGKVLPHQLTCSILLPDGTALSGNGKNDYCLHYLGQEGVEITFNKPSLKPLQYNHWNTETYSCLTKDGEWVEITKNIYRNDEYIVDAFGFEFVGYKGTSHGIADGLIVVHQGASYLEAKSIKFKSSAWGEPESITVHQEGGRAPYYSKIKCN